MIKFPCSPRLEQESLLIRIGSQFTLSHELQRYQSPQALLSSSVNHTHAASRDLLQDLVVPDLPHLGCSRQQRGFLIIVEASRFGFGKVHHYLDNALRTEPLWGISSQSPATIRTRRQLFCGTHDRLTTQGT